jgi:hypothetical protein
MKRDKNINGSKYYWGKKERQMFFSSYDYLYKFFTMVEGILDGSRRAIRARKAEAPRGTDDGGTRCAQNGGSIGTICLQN